MASLHPTTDLVLPFLTRLVDASNPVAIRREAAEGFDHHHDPRSVEILLRVARNDAASEVRAEAAETIGEVQTPQSVPALTDLATRSPDPAVRREAAEAFADQPPDLALPAIERLIATSVDDDALGEAIEALGEIKDPRVLPLLVRTATGHSNQRAQQEAVETLGEIEDPAADAALVRIVWEQKDETIQREAVETLGERTPAPVAELERILREHQVEGVQAEAMETLADGRGPPLSATLLEVATSGRTANLRREALDAIGDAAANTTDVETLDKAQRAIEHAIFKDADRDVQMEALDAWTSSPRTRRARAPSRRSIGTLTPTSARRRGSSLQDREKPSQLKVQVLLSCAPLNSTWHLQSASPLPQAAPIHGARAVPRVAIGRDWTSWQRSSDRQPQLMQPVRPAFSRSSSAMRASIRRLQLLDSFAQSSACGTRLRGSFFSSTPT